MKFMDEVEALYNLHSYPSHLIFNFDETMVELLENKMKVMIRATDSTPVVSGMPNFGEHITLGVCISAEGRVPSPLLIMHLKTLPALPTSISNYYTLCQQPSGWITSPFCESHP